MTCADAGLCVCVCVCVCVCAHACMSYAKGMDRAPFSIPPSLSLSAGEPTLSGFLSIVLPIMMISFALLFAVLFRFKTSGILHL